MAKNNDYDSGYRAGRNNSVRSSSDREYRRGYASGKQEYDFWNDKELYPDLRQDGDGRARPNPGRNSTSHGNDPSTLTSMIGGAVGLILIGWCFVGLILFLFWVGGSSSSWWFPWIWRVAFWGGIGLMAITSVTGIVMAISERRKGDDSPSKLEGDRDLPVYKKYPPADVVKTQKDKE